MTPPAEKQTPGDAAAFQWVLATALTVVGLILASVPVSTIFFVLAGFAAVAAVAHAIKALDAEPDTRNEEQ